MALHVGVNVNLIPTKVHNTEKNTKQVEKMMHSALDVLEWIGFWVIWGLIPSINMVAFNHL